MTYLLSLKWHFWEAVADAALAVWAESCGRASGDPSDALLNLKCLELLLFFFLIFVLFTVVKLFLRPFGYYLLL